MALKDQNLVFREGAADITVTTSTRSTALRIRSGFRNVMLGIELRYYNVYTGTGTGTVTFNVQRSADNSTWYTAFPFLPAVTSPNGSANKVAGRLWAQLAVSDEYIAIESSATGTGPNYNYDAWVTLVRP